MSRISRRRRVPVVLQSTRTDCGPASLAAIFAAFGWDVPLAEIRESLDPGRDGISAFDLREEARQRGLDCRGRSFDGIDALARLPLPLLAHWEGNHYIVVTAVGPRRVDVMDPAAGRRRLAHAEFLAGATGVVLTFAETPKAARGRVDRRPTRSMFASIIGPALVASRSTLVLMGLTSLLLLAVGLAVPAVTALVVDWFIASRGRLSSGSAPLVGAVTGVFVVAGVLTLVRGFATALLQRRVGQRLTDALLERLLGAPLQFIEARGPGDLASRVLSTDGLRDVLANRLVSALLDGVVGLVYLVLVIIAEPTLGLITGAVAAVQLLVLGALALRGRRLRAEELLAQARFSSWLFEVATAMAWVKGAGAEHIVGERATRLRAGQLTALHQASRNDALAQAAASAVGIAAPLLLLIVAASSASAGTPGHVVALAALAAAATVPLGNIATNMRGLYEIGSVLDHLQDLADAPVEMTGGRRPVGALRGSITVRRLRFRFTRRDPWTVKDVSFHVPPGAKLAIVGASGSGKSTLAKLLVGLYEPTVGSVAVDGVDLRLLDLPSVRRLIGAVWQEPLLFSGTIQDNITLRVPDATPAAVAEAARLAGIEAEITAMPMNYGTRLGPSGDGLSGGQRQRLALARALVGRPAMLLLDEATSHLDTPTEALIEENLRAIGVTRIVIAHRLSTVRDADMILVMAGGRIVEQGTHQELINLGGEYARMVYAQQQPAPTPVAVT